MILQSNTCLVPISLLVDSLFQHPWGASIHAKVIAYNLYGYSIESQVGNGAIILTIPDSPINLAETISARTPTTITFTWTDGAANGGASVLDYRVTYDQASGDYIMLADSLLTQTYTATGLTAGLIYKFKVESRNEYGFSLTSEPISILCATNPAIPVAPTSTVVNDEVVIDWTAPSDQGTPILGYNVYFRKSDNTYETELVDCDGSVEQIVTTTECTVKLSTLTAAPYSLQLGD